MQAVQELDKLCSIPGEACFVREAVLRRLTDDEASIVSAVLSGGAVKTLSPADLSAQLTSLLERSHASYTSLTETKTTKKIHRTVIKQVGRCTRLFVILYGMPWLIHQEME